MTSNIQNPGPGAYDADRQASMYRSRSAIIRTSSSSKGHGRKQQKKVEEPGPGHYHMSSSFTARGPKLGGRPLASKRDDTPGPGAYTLDNTSNRGLSRSVSAFLSRDARFKELKRDRSPGPAAYSVSKGLGGGAGVKLHPKLAPSSSVLRSSKGGPRDSSPGPGAYDVTPRGLTADFKPSS